MGGKVVVMDAVRPPKMTGERSSHSRANNIMRRLLCCCCLQAGERDSCLGQDQGRNKEPDTLTIGDGESVHIIVEDLGMENPNFSLLEKDRTGPTQRCNVGRSASSVSMCQRSVPKKKLVPLSSLPLQPRTTHGSLNSEEDSAVDSLLFGMGSASDGGLLTPPVINLIPPTPSDVVDDDQFFDINSEEESLALTSGSEGVDSTGSFATGDPESEEDQDKRESSGGSESEAVDETVDSPVHVEDDVQRDTSAVKENRVEQAKRSFLRSTFQVPPLPEYPRKRSFNTGINLLQFTEHNLDDLNNKDASNHELLKAELRLLPLNSKMDNAPHLRKPAARTCSLGDSVPRSHTFHSMYQGSEDTPEDEGSPRQRRITVASYIPQTKDQNGNFAEKDLNGHRAKTLPELNTEEVCQWFSSIGLEKCLPYIRDAELCGTHIASIDMNTLETLQVSSVEERERLLSAIYQELHPPNTAIQRLDSLLETFGPNNVEIFTAALVSMSKSKSSPHMSCANMNQCSFRSKHKGQGAPIHRNSHLIEITINASERIVHLRTPKETTVGKVIESCLKMLGMDEDRNIFNLRTKDGPSDEFSPEQRVGDLPGSENNLVELHLCKKEKSTDTDPPDPTVSSIHDNTTEYQNLQNQDSKIRMLNQQVDSLQHVILQVQELHHGLVAFCTELKNMESESNTDELDSTELKRRLSEAQGRVLDKRQSLHALRDTLSTVTTDKHKRSDLQLVEKMKLNCQVFKEEISLVHLNRQVVHLRTALEETQAKERTEIKSSGLSQLVSLQSPAMLVATQEKQGSNGHYGFSAHMLEGQGLVVVHTENTSLCVNDRLVEVNGVSVLGSSKEELNALLQKPSAHIIVLRKLPELSHLQRSQSSEPLESAFTNKHQDTTAPQHDQTPEQISKGHIP